MREGGCREGGGVVEVKVLMAGICIAVAAVAQTTAAQRFDVATVRVAAPRDMYVGARRGGPGAADPGRFTWEYHRPAGATSMASSA